MQPFVSQIVQALVHVRQDPIWTHLLLWNLHTDVTFFFYAISFDVYNLLFGKNLIKFNLDPHFGLKIRFKYFAF